MNLKLLLLISATILVCCRCSDGTRLQKRVSDLLHTEIITRGDLALTQEPVTITSFVAERSAGGVHDFYSEGDYWWPDPVNPDSAYIRRDGETNPDNFVAHRHAMIRFSSIVGDLTSAWIVTKDEKYIVQALKHIRAWFIDPETRMNPDLQYAQAIKGIVTGRGIGIIDTIHLLEVVQSLIVMEQAGLLSCEDAVATKDWFSNYLYWLANHPYGKDEMNAKNNHGTCWVMQAAQFAKYTGNREVLDFCRERYQTVLLPGQMDTDGSFPLELARTKPGQRHDGRGAIDPAQHGRDAVFGDQAFEPHHVQRGDAGAEENHHVAPQMRVRMRRRGPRQHHRHSPRHSEHQPRDFKFREAVHPQRHRERQHQQRHDGVDDRTVDRRGHRQSVHDEDLAQHADQQSGADQLAAVGPADLLGLLPQQGHERQQSRRHERCRDQRHRVNVARQHIVIKRVVHGPEHVAQQQGQMGFQSVHPSDNFTRKRQKQCPDEKKAIPAGKAFDRKTGGKRPENPTAAAS